MPLIPLKGFLRVFHFPSSNLPSHRKQDADSIAGSELTMPSGIQASDARATSENLARQQLVAELREASNFMAQSKTKEASNFWRNHVLELQARLRTLHGEAEPIKETKDIWRPPRPSQRHTSSRTTIRRLCPSCPGLATSQGKTCP